MRAAIFSFASAKPRDHAHSYIYDVPRNVMQNICVVPAEDDDCRSAVTSAWQLPALCHWRFAVRDKTVRGPTRKGL